MRVINGNALNGHLLTQMEQQQHPLLLALKVDMTKKTIKPIEETAGQEKEYFTVKIGDLSHSLYNTDTFNSLLF